MGTVLPPLSGAFFSLEPEYLPLMKRKILSTCSFLDISTH
jgi:hypothetical protein